ncbi:MAG: hypothetical protein L0Z62_42160 [Gemmataceae bacterium]|nr:hypothetical protein [Gemmataceae bacterium]
MPRSPKSVPKKPTRKRLLEAEPPPDNPLRRHEELSVDRLLTEAEAPPRPTVRGARSPTTARAAQPAAEAREVPSTAQLRLAALIQSGGMRAVEEGGPVLAGARAAAAPVAPVAGISNWVQLGPTAIPHGQTYSPARVLVTGRVTAIVLDPTQPQTIYLGTAQGGVWKTTDSGRNWVPKSDHEVSLAIGALALDPSNHEVLYAGTGEGNFSQDSYYGTGVLRSTDGGDSWTNLNPGNLFTGARFCRLAVTPGTPERLFAATTRGVFRSTNSGTHWTEMTNGIPAGGAATDLVIDPAAPATVYAALQGQGIYKTTNAGAATPAWTKLAGGLPASGFSRIALGLSPSAPQTLYALLADAGGDLINRFLRSTDGGTTWTAIPLPGGNIGRQGFYNLYVTVDPATPDIIYLGGISVWKATRNATTATWTITNVGATIHPDNHACAIDPSNHLVVYAGNDGGIYRSTDGGLTWSDTINEGPCITQFEFMAQHPTSDAVVFCGTQDNGTEQFRNSPVFYHADDGDGGATAVDPTQPRNVLSTYYGPSPKRSTQGGKFGTWLDVSPGLVGQSLFYPPMVLDETNPDNVAFGTDRINLDGAQGTSGWPTQVTLPGRTGLVSALHYVNSNLLYAATTRGEVYRLTRTGTSWTALALHAAPLPQRWIWDISARPDNSDAVIVVLSGFGTPHVWRGDVPATGPVTWTNISGSGAGTTLPDIPVNALALDPLAPDTYYIATDVAVYRTTNGGTHWTQFSQGLPNCAVFDMRLHGPSRLLRAATHGRGMWERRLDVPALSNVDLFVRDHLMDTGRSNPSPTNVAATFEDPLQHVALGDPLNWWMCADVKVDALEGSPPSYQMNVADVDYVAFESKLFHRNPQRGQINRVYVQLHNRGIQAGAAVTVKLLAADASAGLPPLPADFWTAFPGNATDTSLWRPIGAAQTLASVSPAEPTVLEWEWSTPLEAADHSCLLVVLDSPTDPIPAAAKVFDVNRLVPNEKRVGLKNVHVVSAVAGTSSWTPFQFFGSPDQLHTVKLSTSGAGKWTVGILLQNVSQPALKLGGITRKQPTQVLLKALKNRIGTAVDQFDTTGIYLLKNVAQGGLLTDLKLPKDGLRAMLLLGAPPTAAPAGTLNIVQEVGGVVLGGSTFVLRALKKP